MAKLPVASSLSDGQHSQAAEMADPTGDRQALLTSAVTFLRDPSTSSSPLAQRIAFLESKGLTPPEIQQALAQTSTPSHAPSASQYGYRGGPVGGGGYPTGGGLMPGGGGFMGGREYEKDWRDWFIMGVVGGGVGWLAVKLAQVRSTFSEEGGGGDVIVATQGRLELLEEQRSSGIDAVSRERPRRVEWVDGAVLEEAEKTDFRRQGFLCDAE